MYAMKYGYSLVGARIRLHHPVHTQFVEGHQRTLDQKRDVWLVRQLLRGDVIVVYESGEVLYGSCEMHETCVDTYESLYVLYGSCGAVRNKCKHVQIGPSAARVRRRGARIMHSDVRN